MPPNTVIVDRTSRYGNPFRIGDRSPHNFAVTIDREHAIELYRQILEAKQEAGVLEEWIAPLRGKNLACTCPLDQPCHADVLLEIANAERSEQ